MNDKHPPQSLTDVGLNMYVDTFKLSNLPFHVAEIKLEDLLWHLDMPVWSKDGTDDWNLTPQEVIDKEPLTMTHQKRVEDADITYPIVITKLNSRLVILDGIHRLVKVYLAGNNTIKAKVIPASYLEKDEFKT